MVIFASDDGVGLFEAMTAQCSLLNFSWCSQQSLLSDDFTQQQEEEEQPHLKNVNMK